MHYYNTCFLDDQVLGPVKVLKLESQDGEIHLSWAPPSDGGSVKGYKISWGPGIPDVYHQLVGPTERSHIIKNLRPNREYVKLYFVLIKKFDFLLHNTIFLSGMLFVFERSTMLMDSQCTKQ